MKTADGWERIRTVFQAALERPVEDRAAFVSEACGDDEILRREVESLLSAHAAAAGFLESPAYPAEASGGAGAPALNPGDRVGSFDVLGPLGTGGMGEVYRARDGKLGRDVAIKLLPRAFAADPQRLARFERESRILASLNHPHIAAIHSVEQVDDVRLLVLELVEGETLAERLRQGPLPVTEALTIAGQLAGALEAAHARGIVHRDLKPANIKLTSSSGIKLLDFGLAKERVAVDLGRPAPAAALPEGTTTDGVILGTCAYMSPEQARGRPVDKRADIWAFGCVLFEMLAGTRAFPGATLSDTLAAVLERAPDWARLPEKPPEGIRRVLRRCLEKDPNRRLHDIADARIEIEEALQAPHDDPGAPRPPRRPHLATLAVLVTLALAVAGLGWLLQRPSVDRAPGRTIRFTWPLPSGMGLDSPPMISPDGQFIAFTATSGAGTPSQLFVRALHEAEARLVAGTEGAKQPFWSPDARSLGYFARGRLMKVALDGGAPVEICAAPDGRGGAWSRNGVIVFSPLLISSGLMRVSANGGEVEPATRLDAEQGENSHRWPVFLPDGVHFLYFVRAHSAERRGVYIGRIDGPAPRSGRMLFRSESEAVYAPLGDGERGVLLSVADGRIEVRPFDPHRQVLTGDPATMDVSAGGNTLYHAMMLSVSADVLAHVSGPVPFGQRFASSGRDGEDLQVGEEREAQNWPRLSPDGRRLARTRIDAVPGSPDLWIEDLARGTRIRVTTNTNAMLPVWSPDGERLAYRSGSPQEGVLTIAAADGTGVLSTLPCPGRRCDPTDWSLDGRWLLATVYGERGPEVWALPLDGVGTARPLLSQPFPQRDARFSPDGRLVAYVSEETGRPEVSIQTIDGSSRREVISVAGGSQPVWRRDGTELFFVDPQGYLRTARISRGPGGRPIVGSPVRLGVPRIGSGHWGTQFDVSPDGRRIYFLDRRVDPPPSEFGVIVNWTAMLR